jgi:osmotically inducible protein OsmC
MPIRSAEAVWRGTLKKGAGTIRIGTEKQRRKYSFASRFESGGGTNPEELIGAALAGCFSMALSADLEAAGFLAQKIATKAGVTIEKSGAGFRITTIALDTTAKIPGISEKTFIETAQRTKKNCPVSQALTGTVITLNAGLQS